MSAVDVIYGVSMQEAGVSKIQFACLGVKIYRMYSGIFDRIPFED
jgi:hypothetical protein